MAIILVMDRVPAKGKKRPRIRRIVCDGYMIYQQRQIDETQAAIGAELGGGVNALGIARQLVDSGLGADVYHALREELARVAATERARMLEARRRARKEAEDAGSRDDG